MRRWLWLLLCILSTSVFGGDGTCKVVNAKTCIEGPSTKLISGAPVTRDCWKYETTFNCAADTFTDQCGSLVDKGCTQIGSTCISYETDETTCSLYEQKYQCVDKKGATSAVMSCGDQTYCMDGNCFDSSYAPDGDFGMAIAGLETQRQMGNYMDPNAMTLFNGEASNCSVTLGGLFSCCGTNTKAGSDNGSTATQLGLKAAYSVGSEVVSYYGSYFIYDALYTQGAPSWIQNGFTSLFGGFSGESFMFNPSMSMFGVTIGFGAAPASMAISTQIGSTGFFIGFDPYSFVIAIVIMIVMEMIKCDQSEQILSQKRGQHLCTHAGSFCSQKILGICVEKKNAYCCYNSRLARLVSEAGHAQLGKSFGDPKNPNCSGFTVAEIAMIDFSKINFAEVINEVKAAVKIPDYAVGRAKTMIDNYYTPATP